MPTTDADGKLITVSLTVSLLAHAALLAWALVSFAVKPLAAPPVDALPVDIISATDFSQMTSGIKTAPKVTTPKPLVEKVADAAPVKDLAPKVSAKPEIAAAAEKPPMPPARPAPKPPEKTSEKPPEVAKKPEVRKEPEPKVDEIAEALKRDEAKKQQEAKKLEEQKRIEEQKRLAEQKRRDEQKKQQQEEAKRRQELTRQIESKLALLDKQEARRHEATGATLNSTPSLGSPLGRAATLTQSELDALVAQIQACWNPPVGLADAKDISVLFRLQLHRDGSVAADPVVLNRSSHPLFQIAAESARRAILRCQPYRLPAAKYDVWKDVELNFDPRDMFRG